MGVQQSDDILEHYGIKGMKWGVRRSARELRRARGKKDWEPEKLSEDAKRADAAKKKAKKGGVKALSNQELQQLNNRINLEQNYNRLTAKPSKLEKGQKAAKTVLGVGATVNQAVAFANSPTGRKIAETMIKK